MNDKEIIESMQIAIEEITNEQIELLSTGRVERTFSTNFRDKLISIFKSDSITVDAPYNRHGVNTKEFNNRPIELDIAIHSRFNNDNNILAIELETNNRPERDDIEKLKGLTLADGDYKYKLGLFVVFGVEKKAGEILEVIWFKNGEELELD